MVIQARMSSERLPGKALMTVNGISILGHCIARCRQSQVDHVVVATSEHETDDILSEVAVQSGAGIFRGPLEDVLERFRLLAEHYPAERLIRISGDSPFIDPALINLAIELSVGNKYDLISNVFPRSFPRGQSVELLTRDILENLASLPLTKDDREHVTRYIYKNPSMFRIVNFGSGGNFESIQLSVDSAEDLASIRRLSTIMEGKIGGWKDLISQRTLICE